MSSKSRSSRKKTGKVTNAKKKNQFRPAVEELQPKILLAGNVLTDVVKGSLFIIEDPATLTANCIIVNQDGVPPGTFNVIGCLGTTVDGLTSVTIAGVKKDINITLGVGDDSVLITEVVIGRDLKIDMGADDDDVSIEASTIGRDVKILGGAGDNFIEVGTNTAKTTIGRDLKIDAGDGDDTIHISHTSIGRDVALNLGGGDNEVELGADDDTGVMKVGRNVTITGGDGNDDVTISGVNIGGSLIMNLGNGENDVAFGADDISDISGDESVAIIGKNLIINTGNDQDEIRILQATIGGKIAIDLGDSDTSLTEFAFFLGNVEVGGDLKVTQGVGEARVFIDVDGLTGTLCCGPNIGGSVTLDLGSGDNDVLIDGSNDTAVTIGGDLKIVGGSGRDDVQISDTKIGGNLTLELGSGANHVDVGDDLNIGGSMSVKAGAGADEVDIADDTDIHRHLDIDLGDGDNTVTINRQTEIGGSFTYKGGAGNDDLNLESVTVSRHMTLDLGDGENDVVMGDVSGTVGATVILGNLTITGGDDSDDILLASVTVGGITDMRLDGGDDDVSIISSIFHRAFTLATGAGNDQVIIDSATVTTTFVGPVSVSLGDDDDSITIGLSGTVLFENLTKPDFFDGGAGIDSICINAANVTFAFGPPTIVNFE